VYFIQTELRISFLQKRRMPRTISLGVILWITLIVGIILLVITLTVNDIFLGFVAFTDNDEDDLQWKVTMLELQVAALQMQITTINSEISDLNANVNVLDNEVSGITNYIHNITTNPVSVFAQVQEVVNGTIITNAFTKLQNDASGPLSTSNYPDVYDSTTFCINGPAININDSVIIKVEITGLPSTLLALTIVALKCDGSTFEGQSPHGELDFVSGINQTYATDFFYTYTNELASAGGVALYLKTSEPGYTFTLTQLSYLIVRQHPLPELFG